MQQGATQRRVGGNCRFSAMSFQLLPVKNRRPYNLYCVGGDVKPCSINQSINFQLLRVKLLLE